MNDLLEYIDDYFTGRLSDSEKTVFEEKCEKDPDFAKDVSFYIATRDELQRDRILKKKSEFTRYHEELSTKERVSRNKIKPLYAYISAAVAACLVIFLSLNLLFNNTNHEKLASTYIDENLQDLSVTMGGMEDSLQLGIAAYNEGKYDEAERIFLYIKDNGEYQSEAFKYLGITYLQTEQYDKALEQFDALSEFENQYANPAKFYKALTLMKRSEANDVDRAEELLQEVVQNDLQGRKQAEKWLEELR